MGGYCPRCLQRRSHTATRYGQWIAILTTLPLAAYVGWTLPPIAHLRIVMLAGVLLWYLAVRRIAKRVIMHWIR